MESSIADTLITRLSRNHNLELRSIAAVQRYAGTEQDPLRAGRELRVDAVLEGTIQQMPGDIHVNLRLLDTKTGRAAWTGSFRERASDLFALQDAIADGVAGSLPADLARGNRKDR